jgi:phospholipase/carboxylesterase
MMNATKDLDTLILEPEHTATATVIWLHGLGADGYDFYGVVPQLKLPPSSSIRFIFPHAPIRPVTLNQGLQMRAWYDILEIKKNSLEDEQGICASAQIVDALILSEEQRGIPSSNIVLAGFSQGGVIALQSGLRYPKPLGGIIALSTYLPLAHQLPKELSAANQNIPIFFAHGIWDEVIPIAWARNGRQILNQHQYPVEWHEYEMRHTVCNKELQDISQYLQKLNAHF